MGEGLINPPPVRIVPPGNQSAACSRTGSTRSHICLKAPERGGVGGYLRHSQMQFPVPRCRAGEPVNERGGTGILDSVIQYWCPATEGRWRTRIKEWVRRSCRLSAWLRPPPGIYGGSKLNKRSWQQQMRQNRHWDIFQRRQKESKGVMRRGERGGQ